MPKKMTLPPARSEVTIASATATTCARSSSSSNMACLTATASSSRGPDQLESGSGLRRHARHVVNPTSSKENSMIDAPACSNACATRCLEEKSQ